MRLGSNGYVKKLTFLWKTEITKILPCIQKNNGRIFTLTSHGYKMNLWHFVKNIYFLNSVYCMGYFFSSKTGTNFLDFVFQSDKTNQALLDP